MDKIIPEENKVLRHIPLVRTIHWVIAVAIFTLYFSGFGQMPIYKRYKLTDMSLFSWTGDYYITLKLHYIASVVLIIAAIWHVVYHSIRKDFGLIPRTGDIGESIKIIYAMLTGKQEPPADKYLAEQRLAYVFVAGNILLLILSGMVKVIKNFGIFMAHDVLFLATLVHNITAVLLLFGIVMHLLAFVPPANRKLLPSMFTGKVDLDYAEHRHSIWLENLRKKKSRDI